jgi:cytochrome c-type protein NapB
MRAGLALTLLLAACGRAAPGPGAGEPAAATAGTVRADRRAYDGAPPTVPHPDPGAACAACHDADGQAVGTAYAPASPHAETADAGATQRCRQCHAFVVTDGVFVAGDFVGLPQNLRRGGRATPGAPPTIPHSLRMRERCVACHAGPGARAEIRTPHPDRTRCVQCHVSVTGTDAFPPEGAGQGDEP